MHLMFEGSAYCSDAIRYKQLYIYVVQAYPAELIGLASVWEDASMFQVSGVWVKQDRNRKVYIMHLIVFLNSQMMPFLPFLPCELIS